MSRNKSSESLHAVQSIATTGGGNYVFISDENEIAEVFGSILGGLISLAARDIEVILRPIGDSTTGKMIISIGSMHHIINVGQATRGNMVVPGMGNMRRLKTKACALLRKVDINHMVQSGIQEG